MNGFKDKFARFMYGRYGMDQLSRNLSLICLVLLVITMFSRSNVLYAIALAGIIYTYFRVFSRNISKRSEENENYLSFHYKVVVNINRFKYIIKDNKTHKIFKCPSCSQKIRVPRGKGRISIKCPKCRIEFIKKT